MKKNWQVMLLALFMAVCSWFLIIGREKVEIVMDMTLEVTNPPEGMIIKSGLVDNIKIRVRGPKGLVRSLTDKKLSYSVDVSKLTVGQRIIDIDVDKIPLSPAFDVVEIQPNRLTLSVDRIARKVIGVEAKWRGRLNSDFKVVKLDVEPKMVEIRGPESVLRKISRSRILVKEEFPDEVPSKWTQDFGLVLPGEVDASPGQVKVTVNFGHVMRDIWIKVPLEVTQPEGLGVVTTQDYVRLLIEGPVGLFRDSEYRKNVQVRLVIPPGTKVGKYEFAYMVTLPEGCRLVKRNPLSIQAKVRKR